MKLPSPQELKAFRRKLDLNQTDMAAHFGVGRETYANYEKGLVLFQPKHLAALRALGWGEEPPREDDRVIEAIRRAATITLPTRPSVLAGDPNAEVTFDDAMYESEVPALFFTHDLKMASEYELMDVVGDSMRDRILPGAKIVARKAAGVPDNCLAVALAPDGRRYVKVRRYDQQRERPVLDSANRRYPLIDELGGWLIVADVIGIYYVTLDGEPNIEYRNGSPLRG